MWINPPQFVSIRQLHVHVQPGIGGWSDIFSSGDLQQNKANFYSQVAAHLREAGGYRTALLGKAHFEPAFDLERRYEENRRWQDGETGDWRGFDTSIQAAHVGSFGGHPIQHYGMWLQDHHPEWLTSFAPLLGALPGGDTGAPETMNNPIPRELYHTDWVADLAITELDTYGDGDDWFIWLSFPDPHHP